MKLFRTLLPDELTLFQQESLEHTTLYWAEVESTLQEEEALLLNSNSSCALEGDMLTLPRACGPVRRIRIF